MPRRIAVECTCARCTRVWYADYTPEKKEAEITSLELIIRGAGGVERKISYDALCPACAQSVAAHVDQIDKKMEKASPNRRSRAKVEDAEVVPTPRPVPPPSTSITHAPTAIPTGKSVPAAGAPSVTAGASTPTPSRAPGPPSTAQRTPSA